jgi:hypothetical protein
VEKLTNFSYEMSTANLAGMMEEKARPGRPTIRDSWLSANRDRLVDMLSSQWAVIGWQLTTADTRDKLRQVFQPVKDHADNHLFSRLLRSTTLDAGAGEIRRKRKAVRAAAELRFYAREKCDKCVNACREIEIAMDQAKSDQIEYVHREFYRRRAECQSAQDQLRAANVSERNLENELADAEAAFAQDQLLEFIKKEKYSLHPLNLGNAMAGLPYARDVPFIGVWVSRERCAKIESRFWPNIRFQLFKTIESLWNGVGTSATSPVDFFRGKIAALPRAVKPTIPQDKQGRKKRVPNSVRQQLTDNFYYLERAIDKSMESAQNDPRPMPFRILAKFYEIQAEPKTYADQVLAQAKKIP